MASYRSWAGRPLVAQCIALLLVLVVLPGSGLGRASGAGFALPQAGCPMAHCDSRMSDLAGTAGPSTGLLVRRDPLAMGYAGLGCVSNTHTVACTYRGDPLVQSNLVVYDAEGNRIWEDGGQLGDTAWKSAPIIGTDGSVIAVDRDWVLRADPATNTMLWKSAKPDGGHPVSPVLVGADLSLVFVATAPGAKGGTAEISVWDATTGALLSHQPLLDSANGRIYVTRNTVAVQGNRAYVLTEAEVDKTDGRLYAIDVCNSSNCGVRGSIAVRWHYDFKGPSGASPLLIGSVVYFDGRPLTGMGSFMAVADRGATPKRIWGRLFDSIIGVSAAQDPRGGLWVHPAKSAGDALLRLNADTGATEQEVVVSTALGLDPGYVAQSVVSVSQSAAGAVVLTIGAQAADQIGLPSYVAAIDVSSTPAGAALWKFQVADNGATNSAAGQFPIVIGASGARRVVFNGLRSSTFFVGEP